MGILFYFRLDLFEMLWCSEQILQDKQSPIPRGLLDDLYVFVLYSVLVLYRLVDHLVCELLNEHVVEDFFDGGWFGRCGCFGMAGCDFGSLLGLLVEAGACSHFYFI
jgi:hypothetical protein